MWTGSLAYCDLPPPLSHKLKMCTTKFIIRDPFFPDPLSSKWALCPSGLGHFCRPMGQEQFVPVTWPKTQLRPSITWSFPRPSFLDSFNQYCTLLLMLAWLLLISFLFSHLHGFLVGFSIWLVLIGCNYCLSFCHSLKLLFPLGICWEIW